MIYGYARCSTNESKQDINRQIKELRAAGADEVILPHSDRGKRKSAACDSRKQHRLALFKDPCAIFHACKKIGIKLRQLVGGVFFFDVSDFSVVYAIIGQAGLDALQSFGAAQKVRIALSLRKVYRCGRL